MACSPEIARENGRKGGRKRGPATIEREKAREYIAERIGEYMPEIFEVMIKKVRKGDTAMLKELFDRGFGKALQRTDITSKDEKITIGLAEDEFINIINGYTRNKSRKNAGSSTPSVQ